MRLIIRADAGLEQGTGHVMRMIALAQAWQRAGGVVHLLGRIESEPIRDRVTQEGIRLTPLNAIHPNPSDLDWTLEALDEAGASSWLAADGYHFTPDYQVAIREAGHRLLLVDDLVHHERYHANILVNQNIHAPNLDYVLPPESRALLGTDYAMLRAEFLDFSAAPESEEAARTNLLVTLGGSDPEGVVLRVLDALESDTGARVDVYVVVGGASPHVRQVRARARSLAHVEVLVDTDRMPELMAGADLAISAGGSTCWELCYMGVPSVLITIAENQRPITQTLDETGAAVSLGWHETVETKAIRKALKDLLDDPGRRRSMSKRARAFVDGGGADRIVDAMLNPET